MPFGQYEFYPDPEDGDIDAADFGTWTWPWRLPDDQHSWATNHFTALPPSIQRVPKVWNDCHVRHMLRMAVDIRTGRRFGELGKKRARVHRPEGRPACTDIIPDRSDRQELPLSSSDE